MEYFLTAVGGILGTLSRFLIGGIITEKASTEFPIATLIINITGAFLLGIVSSVGLSKDIYTFAGIGFLGAFTTFSTFMYEGYKLFQFNKELNAYVYIIGSLVLGIIGYTLGYAITSLI